MVSRKSFLIRCRKRGVLPAHIANGFPFLYPLLEENGPYIEKLNRCVNNFQRSVLNIEIQQTYHKISQLKQQMTSIASSLRSFVPEPITTSFLSRQSAFNSANTEAHTRKTKKKFARIMQQSAPPQDMPTSNPRAIYNGTQKQIPPEMEVLLSLGPKFSLPITQQQQIPYYHLLGDVESILRSNPDTTVQDRNRCAIANSILNYIHQTNHPQAKSDPLEKFFSTAERVSKKFLRENPDVLVIPSDKGNKTVLITANDYRQKMLATSKPTSVFHVILPVAIKAKTTISYGV